MRKYVALVCFLSSSTFLPAQPLPKGKETGLISRVSIIDAANVSSLTADNIAGYQTSFDGTRFTLLHVRKTAAAAVRVDFDNVRLPEGAALIVYGTGSGPAWIYKPDSEDSPVVEGQSAFIEIQCGAECPSDLPFDIAGVAAAEVSDAKSGLNDQPQHAVSVTGRTDFRGVEMDYEVIDGMAVAEGDMILGSAHEMFPSAGKDRPKEAVGLSGTAFRWPKGRVPYTIDSKVTNQSRITDAVAHWNTMLGGVVRFVPRTNETVYLRILSGGSCRSSIGMGWTNTMYLASGCRTGNVIHELGHALGLYHEHVRQDRDQHVRVRTENIVKSAIDQFSQMLFISQDLGNYDFNSIMHYGAYSYSSNGKPTIETIPAGIPIGQRTALSSGDIAAVRKMYGAPSNTPAPAPEPDPVPSTPLPPTSPSHVEVTISANPASEHIVVDGKTYKGSISLQWTVGSTHTLGAANRGASNGSSARFVRWSDGGAVSHSVTANGSDPLYKADFALSYSVSATSAVAAKGGVSISPESSNGYYPANAAVQLSAQPALGYCFTGWTGLIGGTPANTTLSITKPYSVTAQFAAAAFTLSRQVVQAPAKSGSQTVDVTATSGCSWTASSGTAWVHVSSVPKTGSGVLQIDLDTNQSGTYRVGTVLISGRSIYIVQAP